LFVAYVEKLDDELYKALQFTVDVYGSEYQEILANSSKFLVLLKRVLKFFEETKQTAHLSTISLRFMEQVYFKPDSLNAAVYEAIHHGMPEEEKKDWVWPADSLGLMTHLSRNVFAVGASHQGRLAMSSEAIDYVKKPTMEFIRDSWRLVKRCTKPDRSEFSKIAQATSVGFAIMGFIGFFVKLIFIPINNIIVGAG